MVQQEGGGAGVEKEMGREEKERKRSGEEDGESWREEEEERRRGEEDE